MTEKECVTHVAKTAGISNPAATKAITAFCSLFFGALGGVEKVEFPGGSVGGSNPKSNQ